MPYSEATLPAFSKIGPGRSPPTPKAKFASCAPGKAHGEQRSNIAGIQKDK